MSRIASLAGRTALAAVIAVAVACATETTGPGGNPLQGLIHVAGDTTTSSGGGGGGGGGNTACNLPSDGPGFFQGKVVGYQAGGDTLTTAVPLANVTVTAYKTVGNNCATLTAGDKVAEATTNSAGHFVMTTLPGGDYFVTVLPATNAYNGAYALATASSSSGGREWFVMLRSK